MKYTLLFFLLLLSCTNKNSNYDQANNDSIEKYLQLASHDTIPFPERDKYNQKAFSLIDLNRNDTLTRFYLSRTARLYSKLFKLMELKKTVDILYKKSIQVKDSNSIANSYRLYGLYYMFKSKNDSAIFYCFKAKKYYQTKKDLKSLTLIYNDMSTLQNYECDFMGSNKTAVEGLKIAKDIRMLRNLYMNIASNSIEFGDYEKALEYNNKILRLIDNNKSKGLNKNMTFNSIGSIYLYKKEYYKAIFYYNKVMQSKEALIINPENYTFVMDKYAFSKLKLYKLKQLPKLFFDSEKVRNKYNVLNGRNYNRIYLSEYYSMTEDTIKAIQYAKEAIEISKEYKNPVDVLRSIKQLLKVDKKNTQKYSQEYIRISDSLQLAERQFREKFARLEYETEQITQEKETAIKQKWVIASIISSVLLIVILLFVIHRQRAKQKELQLLQTQQKANEEIYQLMLNQQAKVEEARQIEKKRIALELHDGIMNKLASTRLNLFVLSKKNDPETINNCLTYIEDIQDIENEIRNVSHDLNQELFLEKDSFKMLLKQFVNEQNSHNKTHYELQISENVNWEQVSSQTKMHLYRIIQEASHNINKYAKASQATIAFTIKNNQLYLSITDNGSGFDTTKTKEGIGLQNMQQRCQELKGIFSIESNTKGTKLHFKIPMA